VRRSGALYPPDPAAAHAPLPASAAR
jgi:hypothetical protein